MEASAAADNVVDVDVWGTGGALAALERAIEQLEAHRNNVSRAARGHVGSPAGARLSAQAAHLTVAIRSLEDGVHRLRGVRDDTAGTSPAGVRNAPATTSPAAPITVEGGTATPVSASTGDDPFPVPVSTDVDPFSRQFLNVRPSSLIGDLTRAAIERLGVTEHGTWAVHLEGRPLTDELTAADAGLRRGSELVLLRVG